MQPHTKIYFDYFKIEYDPVSGWHNCKSEISGLPAQDIHHIDCRGMGGGKNKNDIFNLIALTRDEHENFGDKKQYVEWLREVHKKHIEKFKIKIK